MASQMLPNQASVQSRTSDLWHKALTNLDDDLRASIDFSTSSKLDILQKTLETAEQKKQLCLWKGWKFEKNGKQIILRDVVEKIIKWLDRFKTIGDITTQIDPVHAVLPWICVRFLLQVRVSDRLIEHLLRYHRLRFLTTRFSSQQLEALRRCRISSLAMQSSKMCICSARPRKVPIWKLL